MYNLFLQFIRKVVVVINRTWKPPISILYRFFIRSDPVRTTILRHGPDLGSETYRPVWVKRYHTNPLICLSTTRVLTPHSVRGTEKVQLRLSCTLTGYDSIPLQGSPVSTGWTPRTDGVSVEPTGLPTFPVIESFGSGSVPWVYPFRPRTSVTP